jgi:lipopolysaccharide biosynthesis regulator YciM
MGLVIPQTAKPNIVPRPRMTYETQRLFDFHIGMLEREMIDVTVMSDIEPKYIYAFEPWSVCQYCGKKSVLEIHSCPSCGANK